MLSAMKRRRKAAFDNSATIPIISKPLLFQQEQERKEGGKKKVMVRVTQGMCQSGHVFSTLLSAQKLQSLLLFMESCHNFSFLVPLVRKRDMPQKCPLSFNCANKKERKEIKWDKGEAKTKKNQLSVYLWKLIEGASPKTCRGAA